MGDDENNLEKLAETLLMGTGLSVLEASRMALELHEMLLQWHPSPRVPVPIYRHVIQLGVDAYAQCGRTVTFREAVEKSLQSRAGRRFRTLSEIRQCCRRLLRTHPELADMLVRQIEPDYCRELVMEVFHTPSTQRKARRLLHGIFSFCMRHGWCTSNPATGVDIPQVQENRVDVLDLKQVRCLLAAARRAEHLPCAPALGLMLWAGIRPTELTRLRWEDVHWEDKVITVEARHSKTGGARQVTLHPILARWLSETAPYRLPRSFIVPRAWVRRWRALRQSAGFDTWHPDTLRHTYASYHLKHFQDYRTLQVDMGHADTQLLRTRYLGMRGITARGAAIFWGERRRLPSGKSDDLDDVASLTPTC